VLRQRIAPITIYEGELPNCIHTALHPNRSYTYRARSIGDDVLRIGTSDWSSPIAVRTSAAPPRSSTTVSNTTTTSTSTGVPSNGIPSSPPPPTVSPKTKKGTPVVKVTWQPPTQLNGALISGFRVQMASESSNGPWTDVFTTPPLVKPTARCVTQHDIANLAPHRSYWFRVAAFSIGGQSNWSRPTMIRTTHMGVPHAPSLPLLIGDTPDGLHIQWNAPDNSGSPIMNYLLSMAVVDDVALRNSHITPPASPATPPTSTPTSFASAIAAAAAASGINSITSPMAHYPTSRIPSPAPLITSLPLLSSSHVPSHLSMSPMPSSSPVSLSRSVSNSSTSSTDSKRSSSSLSTAASPSPSPPPSTRPLLPSLPNLPLGSLIWKPVYDGVATDFVIPHHLVAPSTVYVFRVNAVNIMGTGPWSDLLIGMLLSLTYISLRRFNV
jgi:hypothetical protein